MKPVATRRTNIVFVLDEDPANNLPAERAEDEAGGTVLVSVWQPTEDEQQAIFDGACVYLAVHGEGQPPVSLGVTTEPPLGIEDKIAVELHHNEQETP